MTRIGIGPAGWIGIAAALLLAPAAQAQSGALVTVVHGIFGEDLGLDPELAVDVHVSGLGCVLTDFRFGETSDRLAVPAGSYDVEVSLSDGACGGGVAVSAPGVPFADGENATVIAHLAEDGTPTASKYTNDVTPSADREGRVELSHNAEAGPVDVDVYGIFPRGHVVSLEGVPNGARAAAELRRGFYLVAIAPTGGHPIFFDLLVVREGVTTDVYAVGSVAGGSFQLLSDRQDQVQPGPGPGEPAIVTVIHGVAGGDLGLDPELPVDVHVSGVGCALTDFRFGDVSNRLEVPAGSYDVEVRLSDGACGGAVAIAAPGVPFEEGENATVIAHLAEDGSPTASKFSNDLSAAGWGNGRLALHHTAEAGAVDVDVFRSFWFFLRRVLSLDGVTNGQLANEPLRRGRYLVTVAPSGEHPIFSTRARVHAGEATLVYAVGSVTGGTFQVIVDSQPLEH